MFKYSPPAKYISLLRLAMQFTTMMCNRTPSLPCTTQTYQRSSMCFNAMQRTLLGLAKHHVKATVE